MVKSFLSFVKDIIRERKLIFELAKNDFKAKYAGSFLGVVWAFVQPLVTVLVMWFVFEKGFRSKPVDDVPFILWFVPAYIPWIFFSDMLASTPIRIQLSCKKGQIQSKCFTNRKNNVSNICTFIFYCFYICNLCNIRMADWYYVGTVYLLFGGTDFLYCRSFVDAVSVVRIL